MIESITKLNHKTEWETPKEVFSYIEDFYLKEKFHIDMCATDKNKKCANYISEKEDVIETAKRNPMRFNKKNCWMNPPYLRKSKDEKYGMGDFLECASNLRDSANTNIAVLAFANISSTNYFSEIVGESENMRRKRKIEIYFYPKRIQFLLNKKNFGMPAFSSIVIIFRKRI